MQLFQTAKFSTDATGRNADRVDIGGGIEAEIFICKCGASGRPARNMVTV
jgi:hypothetical protein